MLLICGYFSGNSQTDTLHLIKVHFLYGSKPLPKYKGAEKKFFGGLHGGHVSIELDSIDYGFSPHGKFHIISHRNKRHSIFHGEPASTTRPYQNGNKVASICIPITTEQYNALKQITCNYCNKQPYDYAFLGMRCAASTQDVLSQIGIVEKRGKLKNICTTFYPKKLRKRMFKLAKEKNYTILYKEGRKSRKWERD